MRMSFKGDNPQGPLTYYNEYSHAVDTFCIVSMNRDEYLALNMLLQVGAVRQKIFEKTSKPKINDTLDHINYEITVSNSSQGLKTKDKKRKFLRVEDKKEQVLRVEDNTCFKCNQREHLQSKKQMKEHFIVVTATFIVMNELVYDIRGEYNDDARRKSSREDDKRGRSKDM